MMIVVGLALVEMIFCVVVLALVPRYGFKFGFLVTVLAITFAWFWHTGYFDANQTEIFIVVAYGAYIVEGLRRIYLKRRQAAVEAKRREEELADRRKTVAMSAAYKLGQFAASSSELKRAIRRYKALSSEALEDMDEKTVIMQDVVSIIRIVALETDQIRGRDAIHLKNVASGANYIDTSRLGIADVVDVIETAETAELGSLALLRDIGSPDLPTCCEHFLNFIDQLEISGRLLGLQKAIAAVQSYSQSQESIEDLKEEAETFLRQVQDFESTMTVTAHQVLDVNPGCTQEELKAAYRQKVQEWHPDRLERMAPELRAFASEQLVQINAYKESRAMPSLDEIRSWFQDDDRFDPKEIADPFEDECVRRSEKSVKAEGREATFADALIALAVHKKFSSGNQSALQRVSRPITFMAKV